MAASTRLVKHLVGLGYGTRREVEALFASRRVTGDDGRALRADAPLAHERLRVDGAPLDPAPGSVVLLHKPVGFTTSSRDVNPVVYDLLPPRFLRRDPLMSPVGRLDLDTSGALLFTDDGRLNHRLTSPRHHVPKRYEVVLAHDIADDVPARFAEGSLLLADDPAPLAPAALEIHEPRRVSLILREGRYHQVRRMFAAVGNHVVSLHRSAFGPITLASLPSGAWRVLEAAERKALDDALLSDGSRAAP